MKLLIDTDRATVTIENGDDRSTVPLYSPRAFEVISREWLAVGWSQRYSYTFTWLGRPIIQLPDDLLRIQEVIYRLRPDVIVETGVAHGGSLIFYATVCHAVGRGRVIGVDIAVNDATRYALRDHELGRLVTVVDGDSSAPAVFSQVSSLIRPGERVLVVLDSNHTYGHVLAELNAYHTLVSPGSYIVVTDGVMEMLVGTPGASDSWARDNPLSAIREFLKSHPEFIAEQPGWVFNDSALASNVTYWPSGWLRHQERP